MGVLEDELMGARPICDRGFFDTLIRLSGSCGQMALMPAEHTPIAWRVHYIGAHFKRAGFFQWRPEDL
jgi:hypothetical protein